MPLQDEQECSASLSNEVAILNLEEDDVDDDVDHNEPEDLSVSGSASHDLSSSHELSSPASSPQPVLPHPLPSHGYPPNGAHSSGEDSPPAPMHALPPEPQIEDYLRRLLELKEEQNSLTRKLLRSMDQCNRRQSRHYASSRRDQDRYGRQMATSMTNLGTQLSEINGSLQELVAMMGGNPLQGHPAARPRRVNQAPPAAPQE